MNLTPSDHLSKDQVAKIVSNGELLNNAIVQVCLSCENPAFKAEIFRIMTELDLSEEIDYDELEEKSDLVGPLIELLRVFWNKYNLLQQKFLLTFLEAYTKY